jgi:hypothetical protein
MCPTRNDAGKLVGVFSFLQQPIKQIDFAARKGEGIGYLGCQYFGLQCQVEATGLAHRFNELGKGCIARRIGTGPASKQHSDLIVGHGAETPLERERDQRR